MIDHAGDACHSSTAQPPAAKGVPLWRFLVNMNNLAGGIFMPYPRFEAMTRTHVIGAARTITPKRIQRWSCVVPVDGTDREFPVKQLFMAAANQVSSQDPPVTPADFIPHFAAARLRKLGFVVRYVGDNGAQSDIRSATQGGPMHLSPITVPEKVLAFLREHRTLAFCDDCIAKN